MLTPEKIHFYHNKLEAERTRLMSEISKVEKPEDFGSDVDDFSEEENEAEALATDLAAGQALRERLSEIDLALSKIREGKYGICEKCGQSISAKELELIPETRLCENCKK